MASNIEGLDSTASLKHFIDDELYEQMRRSFLRKGRGRPCDRPHIPEVTNRLLLQLYFLKEEDDSSFQQLKVWLEKLVPHMESITESRIYHRILAIIKACADIDISPEEVQRFLSEPYCFHALSNSLSSLGLRRFHIQGVMDYVAPPCVDVSNEVIVDLEKLRAQERESQSFVHKWLRKLSLSCGHLTNSQIKRKVDKCFDHYKRLSKNRNKSGESLNELNEFLKMPFVTEQAIVQTSTVVKCTMCINLLKENNEQNSTTTIELLKHDNDQLASKLQLQEEINRDLSRCVQSLEEKQKDVNAMKNKLNEEVKEKVALKNNLDNITKSKLYVSNYTQRKQLQSVMSEKESLLNELETKDKKLDSTVETVGTLKKQLKSEQSLKSKYKLELQRKSKVNCDLTDMLECEKDTVKLREERNHRFADNVRKTYYALQGESNVAASNCSSVVATVAKNLFNANISVEDLPSKSTSINFSHEANVIAQHQIVDAIKQNDHFMFGSDATSRQKAHFLEQHIQLSNGKVLSLGFSEIASDDSDTLLEKCIDIFQNMCEIYCLDNPDNTVDQTTLFKEIIRKMKAMMSDRASVMKLFDKKIAAYKCDILDDEDCSTHFIFCNAHFLLALSSAAIEAINTVEKVLKEDGSRLGRDANPVYSNFHKSKETAGVRTIRTVVECLGPRGDEKNGSRQEWLAYCSSKGISSKFTSYRSNRFNNLFQNATALILHRDDIATFLNEYVSHSNLKLQSVFADIGDKRIFSNIAAVSFFHVFFTEPYWLLMNSHCTYYDFPAYVKLMDVTLSLWRAESFDPVHAEFVFPDFRATDTDVAVMRNFFMSDDYDRLTFCSTLHVIVDRCRGALERQLSDFLDGGIFWGELEGDVKTVLSSCPLTNLTGERLFGDLDYDMHKRRNASLHVRSTTTMWKHNKTARWLNSQSPCSVKSLIDKGIKYGPEVKQRQIQEKKAVHEKVKKRIFENKREKDEKEIKVKQRKISAIDAILDVNLVTTKEALDELFNGPKATEKLKDQIRFRSLVRGEAITLKGTKQALYDKLLKHIESG